MMSINKQQLELNFNLHSLQPSFLNYELHYIIASNENDFRFATWDEEPKTGEQKFYCFLSEQELHIPAGNINLTQSYVLTEEPVYPIITSYDDFVEMIERLPEEHGVAKGIRRFSNDKIEEIKDQLCEKYGDCEKHLVKSNEAQHLLFLVKNTDVSISATMVYFRPKTEFTEAHYRHVKE